MTLPQWNSPGIIGKSLWDTLFIDAWEVPGIWTITGRIGQKIDVQPVKGQKGAKTTNEGPDPAQLTLVGELSYDEAVAFEISIDSIHPRKADQISSPKTIEHPSASFLGITQVKIRSIGLPQIRDDVLVISIDVIEHFEQPLEAKQKPKAPTTSASAGPLDDPAFCPVEEVWPREDEFEPSGVDSFDEQNPANQTSINDNSPWLYP